MSKDNKEVYAVFYKEDRTLEGIFTLESFKEYLKERNKERFIEGNLEEYLEDFDFERTIIRI